MKQTQADFEQGYQTALKDIEDKKKEHPEWSMKDIVYDLGYMCPFFPSFWTTEFVVLLSMSRKVA